MGMENSDINGTPKVPPPIPINAEKKPTTDDMLFTVETVSCLGACGLAPVVVINEDVHGQMTPKAALALIDGIAATEKETQS